MHMTNVAVVVDEEHVAATASPTDTAVGVTILSLLSLVVVVDDDAEDAMVASWEGFLPLHNHECHTVSWYSGAYAYKQTYQGTIIRPSSITSRTSIVIDRATSSTKPYRSQCMRRSAALHVTV
jgi:hypothetical protein